MDPDLLLLRQFAKQADQKAFEALVGRYVDLVFSAAMRQVRDRNQAEEITQAVFVLLSQKAGTMGDNLLIGGWLVNATRLVAKSLLRSERRREKHEQRAAAMRLETQTNESNPSENTEISQMIDDAMSRLDQTSRGLLVMQYLEGQSGKQIAEALGLSEDAARKRVSRALVKLRKIFARRGVVVSSDVLGAGLMAMKLTAPAGLAALSAAAASGGGSAFALAKGAAATMALSKATTVATCVMAAILTVSAGVGVAVVVHKHRGASVQYAAIKTVAAPAPAPAAPAQEEAAAIIGTVLAPDGTPVAGAEVLVGTPEESVQVYNKKRKPTDVITDAGGNYALAKPAGHYAVVVRSPAGYAEVLGNQLAMNTTITLEPWGKIEGTVQIAGKPAPAKTKVHLWRVNDSDDPYGQVIHHETEVTADAAGHFVFPQIAPGEAWIYRQDTTGRFASMDWQYGQVEPGKTLQLAVGIGGNYVVGRIEVPDALKAMVAWKRTGRLSYEATVRMEPRVVSNATHAANEPPEQYKAVEEAFGRTEKGKLAKQWMFGSNFVVNQDGTFRIDALPPGKFTLSIRNFEEQKEVNFLEDVAGGEKGFEIAANAPADQPIDIGSVTLQSKSRVRPGDAVADFTVKTQEGGEWKLSDHKGKPVVIICWGAYGSGRDDEMNAFGEFAKKWGNDPRISILGAVAGPNDASEKAMIEKYGLSFPQARGEQIMNQLDNSWPSAVLIDGDGKIVQKHLNGKKLEEYLKKAL